MAPPHHTDRLALLKQEPELAKPDPYSHRAIWRIAAPMIISGISVPLLGLVDTAVMGRLDDSRYLAAVAAGAQLFSVLFITLNFLRMGTTGLTAQAFGSHDAAAFRHALARPALIALTLAALLILLQLPLREVGMALLGPETAVAELARTYFNIRIWSAPAVLLNFVIIGWLLGMQDARGPLAILLTVNLVNIVLDLVLVLGLGLDVRGVAAATVVAEFCGLGLGAWLVRRQLGSWPAHWQRSELLELPAYRRLFAINGALFIRTLALILTFAFITAQGARMGTLVLAVNALLMNFQLLISFALDGLAHAAEALVGRAVGAGDRAGFARVVRRARNWSLLFALLFSLAYAVLGPLLINMLTVIPEVRDTAREYLPWLVALPLISAFSFFYDGVYVGATRTSEMRNVMVGSALLVFLPTWYLGQGLGNHGLWLAFTLFMLARGLGMHLGFRIMWRRPGASPLGPPGG